MNAPIEIIQDKNKVVKYHVNENSDYVDEITIIEEQKTINIKYQIRPKEECDLLIVQTDNIKLEVCYNNNEDHEDPFFSYIDTYKNTTDIDELINNIKKYIIDIVNNSLNLS